MCICGGGGGLCKNVHLRVEKVLNFRLKDIIPGEHDFCDETFRHLTLLVLLASTYSALSPSSNMMHRNLLIPEKFILYFHGVVQHKCFLVFSHVV